VIELKTGFTTDLLIQATERQRVADAVYVGLPAEGLLAPGKRYDKRRRGIELLLKRLEIGLILVHFSAIADFPPTVEVALHPIPESKPRPRKKRREVILREIAGRSADYNVGGTTGIKRLNAYREQSIFLAACLEKLGPLSPAALCTLGASPKTGAMLRRNVYNWFLRQGHGVYVVQSHALTEIERDYPQALSHCRNRLRPVPESIKPDSI